MEQQDDKMATIPFFLHEDVIFREERKATRVWVVVVLALLLNCILVIREIMKRGSK